MKRSSVLLAVAACRAPSAPAPPPAPVVAVTMAAPAPPPSSPPLPPCVEPRRDGEADTAWVEGDRVFFCMRGEPTADGTQRTSACGSVSLADHSRRVEAPTVAPPQGWHLPYAAESRSRDGRYRFDLKGGEKASGRRALVALTELRTRASKSKEIPYDEHLAFDGWIGDGVVLRTWVEEGPGCVRWLFPVLRRWSFEEADRIDLGGCYGTADAMFHAGPGSWVLVADNGSVVFVDEATLATQWVETGRRSSVADGDEAIAAAAPPLGLILVFGAPYAGDVVQIDMEQRKVVSQLFVKTCP